MNDKFVSQKCCYSVHPVRVFLCTHYKVNIVYGNFFKNNVEVLQVRTLHELKRIKCNLLFSADF